MATIGNEWNNKAFLDTAFPPIMMSGVVIAFFCGYLPARKERLENQEMERRIRLQQEDWERRQIQAESDAKEAGRIAALRGLRQFCMFAQDWVMELPVALGTAELSLDRADAEFSEGLYSRFWEAMEEATAQLQQFHGLLDAIDYYREQHAAGALQLGTLAPAFLPGPTVLPDPSATHERLRLLYRRAQKDAQFAGIYEQRRIAAKVDQTNAILVAGFNSLGDAIERLGSRVCDAIQDLKAEIKFRLADIESALESAAEAAHEQHEAMLTELRGTRDAGSSILEQLRADADRSAEHERSTRKMLDNLQRGADRRDRFIQMRSPNEDSLAASFHNSSVRGSGVWAGDQSIKDYTAPMIVEQLPEVLALPTEQKELLAEELLNQVVLEKEKDPALLELLRRRLAEHAAEPDSGVTWESLRDRLLKRAHG